MDALHKLSLMHYTNLQQAYSFKTFQADQKEIAQFLRALETVTLCPASAPGEFLCTELPQFLFRFLASVVQVKFQPVAPSGWTEEPQNATKAFYAEWRAVQSINELAYIVYTVSTGPEIVDPARPIPPGYHILPATQQTCQRLNNTADATICASIHTTGEIMVYVPTRADWRQYGGDYDDNEVDYDPEPLPPF
jgi:hypothetical protein